MKLKYVWIGAAVLLLPLCSPQRDQSVLEKLSDATQNFALDIFEKIASAVAPHNYDFMISPFSIWTLLVLLYEGADKNTFLQLQDGLKIREPAETLREGYRTAKQFLKVNTSTVELTIMQALFASQAAPPRSSYTDIIRNVYDADVATVDYNNAKEAQFQINNYVKSATRGLIDYVVNVEDLQDRQMVLMSTIFFKGLWKFPFNRTLTQTNQNFYDEQGNAITTVNMMYMQADVPYTLIQDINAHVIELPYGEQDRLSMIVMLPRKGVLLRDMIKKIKTYSLLRIIRDLKVAHEEYGGDEVEVYLPRFSTTTDFALNVILEQMGILDVFDPNACNLSKMTSQNPYLSRVFHKTRIDVNEEGTVASAATIGILANKIVPPRFFANRPFAYLIVEKKTNSLVFCGQVVKPSNV